MAGRAVVIGGGIAGMLAAKALAAHVETVTVVERDRYPQQPEFRKGVPQARHLHLLVSGGQHALDDLLPGANADLAAAGAHRLDLPRDVLTLALNGWMRRFDEQRHALISCTRPLLDHVVRHRVTADLSAAGTDLDIREAHEVTGLLGGPGGVTGVRLRARDGGARAETELTADVVVDASGRGSRAPAWLTEIGHHAPREEIVDAGLGYATRLLRLQDPPQAGVYIQPRPGCPRGGVLAPVENGAWVLTLYGVRGHQPPTDEEGFAAYPATLPDPYLAGLLKGAEPLGPVHGFRDTANRRRHYDEPGAVPDGFLAMADAMCTFNPIYGQGISVAALGALALHATLLATGLRPDTTAQAQRAVARTADTAWLTAVGADRPYSSAGGTPPTLADRLKTWYFNRLLARATVDPVVGAAFRDVLSLTAPLERFAGTRVALRTLLLPSPRGHEHPPLESEPLP